MHFCFSFLLVLLLSSVCFSLFTFFFLVAVLLLLLLRIELCMQTFHMTVSFPILVPFFHVMHWLAFKYWKHCFRFQQLLSFIVRGFNCLNHILALVFLSLGSDMVGWRTSSIRREMELIKVCDSRNLLLFMCPKKKTFDKIKSLVNYIIYK